jgi:hypothetical protein
MCLATGVEEKNAALLKRGRAGECELVIGHKLAKIKRAGGAIGARPGKVHGIGLGLGWSYLASKAKIAALHSAFVGGLPSCSASRFQSVFGLLFVTVRVIFMCFSVFCCFFAPQNPAGFHGGARGWGRHWRNVRTQPRNAMRASSLWRIVQSLRMLTVASVIQ